MPNQQDLLPGSSGFKKHRVQHEPAADVAHQQELQPGLLEFKGTHKNNHSVADSPILTSLYKRRHHDNNMRIVISSTTRYYETTPSCRNLKLLDSNRNTNGLKTIQLNHLDQQIIPVPI